MRFTLIFGVLENYCCDPSLFFATNVHMFFDKVGCDTLINS